MTTVRPMPMAENLGRPMPHAPNWSETTCPRCGRACYETPMHRQARQAEPDIALVCAACALNSGAPVITARVPEAGTYQRRLAT